MAEKTQVDYHLDDPVWLVLSDDWLAALQREARSGDETNMRLYIDCLDLKRGGTERLPGTVDYVNAPLDDKGYGHANVMVPMLGCRTSSDGIGVDFRDLEPRDV